jgi:1-acyl-sn-glycerol-3-phosphate acyltransferase
MTPAQRFFLGLNYAMCRILWRAEANGPLPVSPGQGAVIVSNHRAPVDPSFFYLATDRIVHWMVAKEYCAMPVVGRFLRLCEVIPVGRGGIDTAATKMAIRYAAQGGLVGMFPEGRINATDRVLLPGRPGAAMIALKAGVPLIPAYVSGSPYNGRIWASLVTPAKVRLTLGQPIDVSPYRGRENDRKALEELTRRLLVEIARLAGQPDFQPQLAGRFYKPDAAT